MSKYDPLKAHLLAAKVAELPMRFAEIEQLLGFKLPASARLYPAWWSNNVGTHVSSRAWREAGWKTSRVDIGAERVVFVRDAQAAKTLDAREGFRQRLTPAAARLLEERAEYHHDEDAAIAELLNTAALDRRRRLIDFFRAASPDLRGAGIDSADLIREDRDGR